MGFGGIGGVEDGVDRGGPPLLLPLHFLFFRLAGLGLPPPSEEDPSEAEMWVLGAGLSPPLVGLTGGTSLASSTPKTRKYEGKMYLAASAFKFISKITNEKNLLVGHPSNARSDNQRAPVPTPPIEGQGSVLGLLTATIYQKGHFFFIKSEVGDPENGGQQMFKLRLR